MNKKIIWVLIILIVLGGGYYFFSKKSQMKSYNTDDSAMQTQTASSSVSTTAEVKTYAMADVSTHASSASCWSAISGKVYDLTSWIGKHPGGDEAILAICGKDGSQLFDGKHGMDPKAKAVLPKFYLGDLAN